MRGLFVQALKWARDNTLEACVMATVVGTSTMIHDAMLKAGVPDGLYLWLAILAVDFLVVLSGAWGGVGLFVAFIICTLNIFIVLGIVPGIAPAMFSISALLGTLGSYTQKQVRIVLEKREVKKSTGIGLRTDDKGMLLLPHYSQMNLDALHTELKISYNKARWLKQQFREGRSVPASWVTAPQTPPPRPRLPQPSPSRPPEDRTGH